MEDEHRVFTPERRRERVTDSVPSCIALQPLRSLAAGETLIAESSPVGALYFLAQGTLDVRKDGVQLAEVNEVGAVFGDMSVLLGSPHTAEVTALTDAAVYVVDQPVTYFLEHPDVALYVSRILARRLNALNRYLVDVKRQFGDQGDHLTMVDDVLGALMNKHPREIERRRRL